MKKHSIYFFLFLLTYSPIFAQNVVLSGYIYDAKTQEPLIQASVEVIGTENGALSNATGYYIVQVKAKDTIHLEVNYIGYATRQITVIPQAAMMLNFAMELSDVKTDTLHISNALSPNKQHQMSSIQLQAKDILRMPTIFGEPDVLKAIQLLPGIQAGVEGTAGVYVRGGSTDQNLVLIDDIPAYYLQHLGGFLSMLDAQSIQHINVLKGAFPARYGGRLSSVMDIRLKEGSKEKRHTTWAAGFLLAKYATDGPIGKNKKATFLATLRFTPIGPVAAIGSAIGTKGTRTNGFNAYDMVLKYSLPLDENNKLNMHFYAGEDRLFGWIPQAKTRDTLQKTVQNTRLSIDWHNRLGGIKWHHLYAPNFIHTVTVGFTNFVNNTRFYDVSRKLETGEFIASIDAGLKSGVSDIITKADWEYLPSARHQLKWGGYVTGHKYTPGISRYIVKMDSTTFASPTTIKPIYALESAIYAEDEMAISDKCSLNAGLHLSHFLVRGKNYWGFQPRLSMLYKLNSRLSLKASANRMQQYLHLLTTSYISFSSDLWVPPTEKVAPQQALQTAFGAAYQTPFRISLEAEIYYKRLSHQITYQEGSSFNSVNTQWEDRIATNGKGNVAGLELLARKDYGQLTGWASYTLSFNRKQFADINGGKSYWDTYDRRHNVNVVANYQFSPRLQLSANWTFSTGRPVAIADLNYTSAQSVGSLSGGGSKPYEFGFVNAQYFSQKNNQRMLAYHRLDIGLQLIKAKTRGTRTWSFGLYNAYNRLNPMFYYYKTEGTKIKLYGLTLFPILPSVSYTRTF